MFKRKQCLVWLMIPVSQNFQNTIKEYQHSSPNPNINFFMAFRFERNNNNKKTIVSQKPTKIKIKSENIESIEIKQNTPGELSQT